MAVPHWNQTARFFRLLPGMQENDILYRTGFAVSFVHSKGDDFVARILIILAAVLAIIALVLYFTYGGRRQCRNCGSYISRDAEICPVCGCGQYEEDP